MSDDIGKRLDKIERAQQQLLARVQRHESKLDKSLQEAQQTTDFLTDTREIVGFGVFLLRELALTPQLVDSARGKFAAALQADWGLSAEDAAEHAKIVAEDFFAKGEMPF
ncbi:hypothetical protein [Hydrocarboniphaga sp.]|uniref:hypothetical protein n=1 Tax=Hydrocarboniphaga sp. TaxID=2033016 RepID=UPI003D0BE67D